MSVVRYVTRDVNRVEMRNGVPVLVFEPVDGPRVECEAFLPLNSEFLRSVLTQIDRLEAGSMRSVTTL